MPKSRLRSAKEDALTELEAGIMLSACVELLDNLTIRLPLYAGMRIGEVQHLRNSWLDWDKGIIVIPSRQECSCYECRKWRNNIWTPKTRAGQNGLRPGWQERLPRVGNWGDRKARKTAGNEK